MEAKNVLLFVVIVAIMYNKQENYSIMSNCAKNNNLAQIASEMQT